MTLNDFQYEEKHMERAFPVLLMFCVWEGIDRHQERATQLRVCVICRCIVGEEILVKPRHFCVLRSEVENQCIVTVLNHFPVGLENDNELLLKWDERRRSK